MSAVSEDIVREYFEALGFYTYRPIKYQVSARAKRSEEEIDLLVINSRDCASSDEPREMVLRRKDVLAIPSAVVSVRGWHTERFTPALLAGNPELCRFAAPETFACARALIPDRGPTARILCLPGLPASDSLRAETLELLSASGVDGALLFRDMLLELERSIDVSANYEKSDIMQFLRILKNYDLIKDPQMDFFERPRRRRSAASTLDGSEEEV